jgi:hypothetical protein
MSTSHGSGGPGEVYFSLTQLPKQHFRLVSSFPGVPWFLPSFGASFSWGPHHHWPKGRMSRTDDCSLQSGALSSHPLAGTLSHDNPNWKMSVGYVPLGKALLIYLEAEFTSGLRFTILLRQPPKNSGITGVHHHTQLYHISSFLWVSQLCCAPLSLRSPFSFCTRTLFQLLVVL